MLDSWTDEEDDYPAVSQRTSLESFACGQTIPMLDSWMNESEDDDLELTGKGKYGLRPDQLKFGDDKIVKLSTDSNVESYLMVTEFRRN